MKKLNQHLLLAATMMLLAGSAYAQAPTNTYQGAPQRQVATPTNTHSPNAEVTGASAGTYSKNYADYSQDSYVSQTGSGNYATVDQVNTTGALRGSTAILDQTGDNNNATQRQSATGNTRSTGFYSISPTEYSRNLARATQNGTSSQSDQSQSNGIANTMTVFQGSKTSGNRAIQTQGTASDVSIYNQATINQTAYQPMPSGMGNRAEQTQTGVGQVAQINQESINSYAKQVQNGGSEPVNYNSAFINQSHPGMANTAMQTQSGTNNVARIQQALNVTANNNYAAQTQSMNGNQADILQQSSNNYAEQVQSGTGAGGGNNYSSITQLNVASAAYTTQSGNNNAVLVNQH